MNRFLIFTAESIKAILSGRKTQTLLSRIRQFVRRENFEYLNHCLASYPEADRLVKLNEGWELDKEREDYNIIGAIMQTVYLRQKVKKASR